MGLAVLALGGFMVAQTPNTATRVAYLEGVKVVENAKGYDAVKAIRDRAEAEMKPMNDRLRALEAKIDAGTASAAERQEYQTLAQTARQTLAKWEEQQNKALAPIAETANATIARVAKAQGVGLVFDSRIAIETGTIIYADASLDLTNAVVQALPK
ncbi:MAG: OmpH family outer membrane protein [Meiothermus sp.]|nr:OmpH family outer membrane protein [Meiothermus sp.]